MFMVARFAFNTTETQETKCAQTGNLCGDWQLSYAEQPLKPARTPKDFKTLEGLKTIPAKVPGNVELDLVREGLEPDPRKGDNVYKFRKYESYQWMYSKEFTVLSEATLMAIIIAVITYFLSIVIFKILDRDDYHMLPYGDKIYKFLQKIKIFILFLRELLPVLLFM